MYAVEVNNLSKNYYLNPSRDTSIKEFILKGSFLNTKKKEIKALHGVSFKQKKGSTLGIVGGNGSGKSTLLKIIAGITEPSSGEISINGRTAALLELGAGFHPELTGLENLYLNGSILGLPKSILDSKAMDIFDFAELAEFINTPVKHYSSGMYVRLGFSIAVNLEPDILIVDEVLSVGDASFQSKSFEKIDSFRRSGKSVIFVTHNLSQAEEICDEIIWLDKGRQKFAGKPQEIIEGYLEDYYDKKLIEKPIPYSEDKAVVFLTCRLGNGKALINKVRFLDKDGVAKRTFHTGDYIKIEMEYSSSVNIESLDCRFGISTEDGKGVTIISASSQGQPFAKPPARNGKIIIIIENLLLCAGRYFFTPAISPSNDFENPYDLHMRYYTLNILSNSSRPVAPTIELPAKFTLL